MDAEELRRYLNEIIAVQRADHAISLIVLSHLALSKNDWRESLEVMRGNAENAAKNFQFEGWADQAFRDRVFLEIEKRFDQTLETMLKIKAE